MKSFVNEDPQLSPTDEWQWLAGNNVEVRLAGKLYRRGVADMAMPDASGIWVAADGIQGREYIDKASGFEIWSDLYAKIQP
ncbi:hypothetical protein [Arthrobacter sp. KNU40]|uniref:hypothetical protein n=1 Tax=Arthrobacter sp. KNU40 TaxID=3447965 RepID=UPI003F607253